MPETSTGAGFLEPAYVMGRRRCPVCRSREWHKEPSSGLIICSEGHVLQNYRNETTETTELGPHALRKRTLKSNHAMHAQTTKADETVYHGTRARYLYFECLQLLLRMQTAVLISEWKLPPEFETVCRDIWALHLSLLSQPPPPEPYLHAQEQGLYSSEDLVKDPPQVGEANNGRHAEPRVEPDDEGESEVESDVEDVTNDPDETHLADLLKEASQSESEPEEQPPGNKGKGTVPLKKHRNRYEIPAGNIAVLILTCWTMRLPVMYIDFIRLIEAYTLPYLEPVRLLPPEMACHLAKETILALSPRFPPSVFALHALASRLAHLCWSTYGIQTPEVNAAPILWRNIRALCGTSTLYALTKTIAITLSLPLTLHPELSPALVRSTRTEPRRHKSDNVPPELALVAAATVVLKLVYGLDGTSRRPIDPADPACALPCLEDYLENLNSTDAGTELFSAVQYAPAAELDDAQMDVYLAFCERALLGKNEPDKTVAEFFPLPEHPLERDARQQVSGGGRPETTPLPEMRPSAPATGADVVQPGSVVRIYNTLDVLGTVPAPYATVLRAGARAVGVGEDDVARIVERFERRLVRWAERQRRGKK